jgi:hypothetical protein
MFNLVAHPEVFSRLREEVDRCLPPGVADEVVVDSALFAEMPYLNAVMYVAVAFCAGLERGLRVC